MLGQCYFRGLLDLDRGTVARGPDALEEGYQVTAETVAPLGVA
jgi:hypothetical protein